MDFESIFVAIMELATYLKSFIFTLSFDAVAFFLLAVLSYSLPILVCWDHFSHMIIPRCSKTDLKTSLSLYH